MENEVRKNQSKLNSQLLVYHIYMDADTGALVARRKRVFDRLIELGSINGFTNAVESDPAPKEDRLVHWDFVMKEMVGICYCRVLLILNLCATYCRCGWREIFRRSGSVISEMQRKSLKL